MFKIDKPTALGLIVGSLIGVGLILVLDHTDNLDFEEKTRKMKQKKQLNDWLKTIPKHV